MISVSGILAARSRICRAPVTAMSMMPGLSRPKTTRRCNSDVELYRWTMARPMAGDGMLGSGKFIGGNGRYLWIGMLGVEGGIVNSWDLSRPAADAGLSGGGSARKRPAG